MRTTKNEKLRDDDKDDSYTQTHFKTFKKTIKDEDPLLLFNEINFDIEPLQLEMSSEDEEVIDLTPLQASNKKSEKTTHNIIDKKVILKTNPMLTVKQTDILTTTPDLNCNTHFKEIFVEYDYLVENKKDKKKEIKSIDHEIKLNNLNLLKNNLFKKLRQKTKETKLRNGEKTIQIMKMKDILKSPEKINIEIKKKKDEENIKLNKQQLMKKKKRMERYLMIKKIKKQFKKKQRKNNQNFLTIKSYINKKSNNHKYTQLIDWRIQLEDQIKNIFSTKNLNVNFVTKTIINNLEMTPFIIPASEDENNNKLNKLELYDGTKYNDINKESQNISYSKKDQSLLEIKADQKKEEILNNLKNKLESLKNKENYLEDAKRIFEESNKTPNQLVINNIGLIKTNHPEEKIRKLDATEKLKVKQRIVNYSMNVFDKIDLKKIIIFWRNNMHKEDFVNRIKSSKEIITKKLEEVNKKNKENQDSKDDKKKSKAEINVKQSYQQPNTNVRDLIPFFNNIYTIQKNES